MAQSKFLTYVDDHQEDYIQLLAKAVAIPSYVCRPSFLNPNVSFLHILARADLSLLPRVSSDPR